MREIRLSENCFGPDVEIDGESLFIHEYDNRNPEMISDLQDQLIDKLKSLKNSLGMSDWTEIAMMVINGGGEFEYDEDNSKEYESCEQCGNWNHTHIYIKKDKNDE